MANIRTLAESDDPQLRVHEIRVDIPEEYWLREEGADDPFQRLYGPLVSLNGVTHHVEAIQVMTEGDTAWAGGGQNAAGSYDEQLDGLYAAGSPDGPFDTVRLFGRDYVIFMYPGT